MRRQVFYSFHYGNDVMRVQQIRNIGALEANAPVSANDWETVKRGGDAAIKRWIDETMRYRSAVVVLVGQQTASRPWVEYEIQKAWEDGKGLLGVHVHNIRCPRTGTCPKGTNPFDQFKFNDGRSLSSVVECYDPNPFDAYGDISRNLESWIEAAIARRA